MSSLCRCRIGSVEIFLRREQCILVANLGFATCTHGDFLLLIALVVLLISWPHSNESIPTVRQGTL